MDNELDTDSSQTNLIKWPFYIANALILGIVLSYLFKRPEGPIDQWEIATCVFAVALSSMLFFVPHLVEYFISISVPEKPVSSRGDGLLEKTYLELKGLKEDLSDFGVKLEKIPSIIEKINAESDGSGDPSESFTKLEDRLDAIRAQLEETLAKLAETSAAPQPEPDPRVEDVIASVSALEKTVERLDQEVVEDIGPEEDQSEPDDDDEEDELEEESADEDDTVSEDNLAKVDRILEETKSDGYEPENQTAEFDLDEPEGGEEDGDEGEAECFLARYVSLSQYMAAFPGAQRPIYTKSPLRPNRLPWGLPRFGVTLLLVGLIPLDLFWSH